MFLFYRELPIWKISQGSTTVKPSDIGPEDLGEMLASLGDLGLGGEGGLGGLEGSEDFAGLAESLQKMMEQLVSKEVMYDPLKQLSIGVSYSSTFHILSSRYLIPNRNFFLSFFSTVSTIPCKPSGSTFPRKEVQLRISVGLYSQDPGNF
jgi:hypothetical protein